LTGSYLELSPGQQSSITRDRD